MSITFVEPSPSRAFVGSCTGPFRVQAQDAEGAAASVAGAAVVTFSKTGGATASYYGSPDCLGAEVTEVSIPEGSSTVDFYLKNSVSESATITADASSSGLGSASRAMQSAPSFDDAWSAAISAGPSGRYAHSAIWTGSRMIIWGGASGGTTFNSGFSYDPVANSWDGPISSVDAPTSRRYHSAVWTGTRMIVWGGTGGDTLYRNSGRVYDPVADAWSSSDIASADAPSARESHSAVWTGTEMVIWGGNDGSVPLDTGGHYNPVTNTWRVGGTPLAGVTTARSGHSAIWTGTEMIVWGGTYWTYGGTSIPLNSGIRYNPAAPSWGAALPALNAPQARQGAAAVWTGSQLVVWGGCSMSEYGCTYPADGKVFDPAANSWAVAGIASSGRPSARADVVSVWTGKALLVWGGHSEYTALEDGFFYVP